MPAVCSEVHLSKWGRSLTLPSARREGPWRATVSFSEDALGFNMQQSWHRHRAATLTFVRATLEVSAALNVVRWMSAV